LASLTAAAVNGEKKPDNGGYTATKDTSPIASNPENIADAATKVIRDGVFGVDQGTDAAIDKLPDRTAIKNRVNRKTMAFS
jgi:hypothetical protein